MKWFLGAAVLLLLALAFQMGFLAYAMYALLAVMILTRLIARAWSENLSARRDASQFDARIGDLVTVSVTVENKGRLPVGWLLIEDLLPRKAMQFDPPPLRVKGNRLQLAMVQGHGSKRLFYQLECNQRGYYQIGPTVLETGDWFGLHRRYRVASHPQFLLVYPRVVPLTGFDISSRRPVGEIRMAHRLYEDPTRISGVRDYQAGDPLNRVHWRATARTGMLQCKVYEPSTIAGATLVLDFHRDSHDPKHEPFRSELAITAAASIANALYQMNQQVGLLTNGRDAADRIRQEGWDYDYRSRQAAREAAAMLETSTRLMPVTVPTQRGPEQFLRILETLARLELTDGLKFHQLMLEGASRLPRDATVLVILPRVTNEEAILLGNLRRRGFAVTAILNLYGDEQFAIAAGRLLAEGVHSQYLRDEASVTTVCQQMMTR